MDIDKALAIASSLAKGINPDTGKPFDNQKAPENVRLSHAKASQSIPPLPLTRSPVVQKYMYQVSEALVRHLADPNRGPEKLELLEDYLARRRRECMPSLRPKFQRNWGGI